MKKNLRLTIILAAFVIIFACVGAASAQIDEPMAGGFSKASTTDKEVMAAARYAVKTQAKKQSATIRLVSINRAETQVVAGRNYRLCLKVQITAKGKKTKTSKIIQTVVFQNLKQKLSLTSWETGECGS